MSEIGCKGCVRHFLSPFLCFVALHIDRSDNRHKRNICNKRKKRNLFPCAFGSYDLRGKEGSGYALFASRASVERDAPVDATICDHGTPRFSMATMPALRSASSFLPR